MIGARRCRRVAFVVALAGLHAACIARAESSDQDKALALQLFDEGRALLSAGSVDDACRKLEESRRLDPLPGTLLNLAVCHERQGRAASAVAEFREARARAEQDRRDDRVALADEHLRALEGKVSGIVIAVPPEADRQDLIITRDGTPVGRAAWGTRIPVDPGEHVVAASAALKKPWTVVLRVAPSGSVQTVTVSPLEDAAPVMPPPLPPPPPVPASQSHGLSPRRAAALVSAGVGVAAVGVGTYFGLRAISKHNDPAATCMLEPCTTAESLYSDAATSADVATAAFAAGLVGLGLGAFLWLGDTSGRAVHVAMGRVTPSFGLQRAGLSVGGEF